MADGRIATLMLVLGLTDMSENHCGTSDGCLGASVGVPRMMVSAGEVIERRADPARETYLRYDPGVDLGPFGQAIGYSVGEAGEVWAGYGATYTVPLGLTGLYIEFHLMPGLYLSNGGHDLGGWLAFRSGLELGYENAGGARYAVAFDHRSNAGIFYKNPGVETLSLRVSAPQ